MIKFNITELRNQNNMTMKQLQELSGIRLNTLTNYSHSRAVSINIKHLDKLCEIFNCDPNDIMTYVPDKEPANLDSKQQKCRMNFDTLLKMGYKEFTSDNAKRVCQKCVEDSAGNVLYFLTIYLYDIDGCDHYETHIQFYQNNTHNPLDLNFYGGWTIYDVERYADILYHSGVIPCFEPYEERNYD